MFMLFSHLLGHTQYFENNLFEDAKKLFSQLLCDLKTVPVSPRTQDQNVKVTKSLFTLESGLSKLRVRAYCSDNFEQVRLSNTYKLSSDGYRFCCCWDRQCHSLWRLVEQLIALRAAMLVCFTKT